MTGWAEIALRLGASIRPLSERPATFGNRFSPFSASLSSTVETLRVEFRNLGADNIVIGFDVEERHIRQNGLPRADARINSPAVEVAFESKYGPLRYATAEYHSWQANLRAIALSMEALRKVDRYGVSKRGEQYKGWLALPTASEADLPQTMEQAVLAIHSEVSDLYERADVDGPHLDDAIREALMRTHPDRGGDADRFRRVVRARELMKA